MDDGDGVTCFPRERVPPHTYPIDSNYIKMAVEGNIGEQRASARLHDVVDSCPPFSVPHCLRLVQGNGPSYRAVVSEPLTR